MTNGLVVVSAGVRQASFGGGGEIIGSELSVCKRTRTHTLFDFASA